MKEVKLKKDDEVFLHHLDLLLSRHVDSLVDRLTSGIAEKVLEAGGINIQANQIFSSSSEKSSDKAIAKSRRAATIDESTFVVTEDSSNIEKKFDKITEETTTKDESLAQAKSKLQQLKRG